MFSVLFFISFEVTFAQSEIYAVTAVDKKETSHNLTKVNWELRGQFNYFYFRCLQGDSEFDLEFSKILTVNFIGSKKKINGDYYRPADIRLTSGSEKTIYLTSEGVLEGISQSFGSKKEIEITDIKSINFHHDGTFQKCPLCNTVFYNKNINNCPFDGKKLEAISNNK